MFYNATGMDSKFSKHLPKYNMLFCFMELENWKKKNEDVT